MQEEIRGTAHVLLMSHAVLLLAVVRRHMIATNGMTISRSLAC